MEYTVFSLTFVFFFGFLCALCWKWSLIIFSVLSSVSLLFFPPVLIQSAWLDSSKYCTCTSTVHTVGEMHCYNWDRRRKYMYYIQWMREEKDTHEQLINMMTTLSYCRYIISYHNKMWVTKNKSNIYCIVSLLWYKIQ